MVAVIVSGGQTGVDRAALDVAPRLGLPYDGWCPRGGLAEDYPDPPGLRADYPNLRETRSADYYERTDWNVRDSDATLIIVPELSLIKDSGTGYTKRRAGDHDKPCHIAELDDPQALAAAKRWLAGLPPNARLNVAGPRASKAPDVYDAAVRFLTDLLAPGQDDAPA